MSLLKDTKRPKFKDLQMLVCEAWGLIANGSQCSDIKILIDIICSNLESTKNMKPNSGKKIMQPRFLNAFIVFKNIFSIKKIFQINIYYNIDIMFNVNIITVFLFKFINLIIFLFCVSKYKE